MLGSALSLLTTYAGRGPDLRPWLKGGHINRDRNLRLQYLAGMGLNSTKVNGSTTPSSPIASTPQIFSLPAALKEKRCEWSSTAIRRANE